MKQHASRFVVNWDGVEPPAEYRIDSHPSPLVETGWIPLSLYPHEQVAMKKGDVLLYLRTEPDPIELIALTGDQDDLGERVPSHRIRGVVYAPPSLCASAIAGEVEQALRKSCRYPLTPQEKGFAAE